MRTPPKRMAEDFALTGPAAFSLTVLHTSLNGDDADRLEAATISTYRTTDPRYGYNILTSAPARNARFFQVCRHRADRQRAAARDAK